mgnify:CR=1 FL=1
MLLYLSLMLTGSFKSGGNKGRSLLQSDTPKSPEKQYLKEAAVRHILDSAYADAEVLLMINAIKNLEN